MGQFHHRFAIASAFDVTCNVFALAQDFLTSNAVFTGLFNGRSWKGTQTCCHLFPNTMSFLIFFPLRFGKKGFGNLAPLLTDSQRQAWTRH